MAQQNIGGWQAGGNEIYVKKDYGAVGDGVADDTTPITNALAAVVADRGRILCFEPGRYLVPAGITNTTDGIYVKGLGSRTRGPGNQANAVGAVLVATTAAAWCWKQTSTANEYKGCIFENMVFEGDADTAGGLRLETNYNMVRDCVAFLHKTGSGFMVNPPSSGNDASWNKFHACMTQDCLTGFMIGSDGMAGAASSCLVDCTTIQSSANSMSHTGTGVTLWDNNSQIIGGKFESHDIGLLLKTITDTVMGAHTEDNQSYDIELSRPSGTSSTRNLIFANTSKIHVGAFNKADMIIGGNFEYADFNDEGVQTVVIMEDIVKMPHNGVRYVGASTPTGGNDGDLAIGTGKLWAKDNGTWKSATIA